MKKPKQLTKREKLDSIRVPSILALRGVKIGPIWPSPDELKDVLKGMRGVVRKKTRSPFDDKYRKKRRLANRRHYGNSI